MKPISDPAPRYWCTRQRAGPLVKECRALRPRLKSTDAAWERREKQAVRGPKNLCVFSRSRVSRLEMRLALFGFEGTFYTLTYTDDGLPADFAGVRRDLRSFFSRARRKRGGEPFDYVYCVEGLHSRFHVHLVLRDSQIQRDDVPPLWGRGHVDAEPLLLASGGFLRIAEYLNKERNDGFIFPVGRHPWSVSRSLKLPPPERWRDSSGEITIPDSAVWRGPETFVQNAFGSYRFAEWIERGPGAGKIFPVPPLEERARARAFLS